MKGLGKVLGVLVAVLCWASAAMAQVFPVDTASNTVLSNAKTDLVAWGTALIGVVLAIYAIRKVKSLIR
jgi:hypothetical protein